jgi:pimeloyl-ACP methyl ester carboxylesterase
MGKNKFKLPQWILPVIFSILLVTSSSGCALNYITEKLDITKKFQESKANVLSTGELSSETVQELRILSLNQQFAKDPEATLATMEANQIQGRQTEQAQALAEAAFLYAENLYKDGQEKKSAKYYLMASANAYDFLFNYKDQLAHSFVSPYGRNMTELYNASISKIVDIYQTEQTKWTLPWKSEVGNTIYNINVSSDPKEQIELDPSDQFLPAYEIHVKGLNNFYKSQGIGAPIVRKVKNTPEMPKYNPFIPKVLSSPITVLFNFSERKENSGMSEREVTVSFLNPYKVETTKIAGVEYPLEADFSTAFGVMLSELKPGSVDLDKLINPEKYLKEMGLKFVQPYDPDKIPVVLVHGLMSSPSTYIQMVNDLMGVESIRKHYQFWVFGYPTGLPIINSSTKLRASLLEAAKLFNPDGKNPNYNEMVIVGHSMGGILSRSMILESSDHLYSSFLTVPVEQLNLTDKERAEVQQTFFFEPLPSVKRAVFIAAPLRGSNVAQGSIVQKLSNWFISLPKRIVLNRQSVLKKNRQYLNPSLNNSGFIDNPLSSVDNLRTDSPLLKAYIDTPTVTNLPYHTIIGIQDATDGPGSSDGIVAYASSHLDGAQSEKLVPASHSCVANPQTVAEVRRILLLHLSELNIK